MAEAKRLGILHVTPELLLRALDLPEGTVLHGADVQFDVNGVIVQLKVEQADLPLVYDGGVIPRVTAVYQRSESGTEFKGWS